MSQLRSSADTQPANLDDVETRVLGCLMEKAVLTPRHYPLTMNGLRNACNQKSGRNPVVSWHEHVLHGALERLARRGFVHDVPGSRARKIEHCVGTALGLDAASIAVLCVLILRGPLAISELLEHASRLHPFEGDAALQAALDALAEHEPAALVTALHAGEDNNEPLFRHCLTVSGPKPPKAPAAISSQKAAVERTAGGPDEGEDEDKRRHQQHREQEIQWMQGELLSIRKILESDAE